MRLNSAAATLDNLAVAGGQFVMITWGVTNRPYVVEARTNFDVKLSGKPRKFYRVRQP